MGGGYGWRSVLVLLSIVFLGSSAGSPACAADRLNGNGNARPLPVIEVWKGRRLMELREGDQVLRQFEVALGHSPTAHKHIRGDTRTPVGHYRVCGKKPASQFHRFLGLNYPNADDAERGYRDQLISAREWADIFVASLRYDMPSWNTALGGAVGIHGRGGRTRSGDWTKGCIAVSDEEIDFIYDRVPVGTSVIINE
jgi:murein L,D-transpeptidase YafK